MDVPAGTQGENSWHPKLLQSGENTKSPVSPLVQVTLVAALKPVIVEVALISTSPPSQAML